MKKIIAVYPGTFDPVTYGHLDVINRSLEIFDKVIVGIAKNVNKKPLFTEEERLNMLNHVLKKNKNVEIDIFDDLLVRYAKKKKASVIIRGLRAISDFEYEFQMSLTNRKLDPKISTIFLMPNEKYTYLNSSLIRELASFDSYIKEFVPDHVLKLLKKKFNSGK
jgi:pantetheine-phosphate adenylyltransferase